MNETLDELLPYVFVLLPCPLMIWSWVLYRRQNVNAATRVRGWLVSGSIGLASVSCILLLLFTPLLRYLESIHSEAADGWYIHSVQVGFFGSMFALALALFASGRLRLTLFAVAALLVVVWAMIGMAY